MNPELGPREVLRDVQALLHEITEREQRLQHAITEQVVAPVDMVFDLVMDSGTTLRRQAEALEVAGLALQEAGVLMKAQAELLERTLSALRQPVTMAKGVAGIDGPGHATDDHPGR